MGTACPRSVLGSRLNPPEETFRQVAEDLATGPFAYNRKHRCPFATSVLVSWVLPE